MYGGRSHGIILKKIEFSSARASIVSIVLSFFFFFVFFVFLWFSLELICLTSLLSLSAFIQSTIQGRLCECRKLSDINFNYFFFPFEEIFLPSFLWSAPMRRSFCRKLIVSFPFIQLSFAFLAFLFSFRCLSQLDDIYSRSLILSEHRGKSRKSKVNLFMRFLTL